MAALALGIIGSRCAACGAVVEKSLVVAGDGDDVDADDLPPMLIDSDDEEFPELIEEEISEDLDAFTLEHRDPAMPSQVVEDCCDYDFYESRQSPSCLGDCPLSCSYVDSDGDICMEQCFFLRMHRSM